MPRFTFIAFSIFEGCAIVIKLTHFKFSLISSGISSKALIKLLIIFFLLGRLKILIDLNIVSLGPMKFNASFEVLKISLLLEISLIIISVVIFRCSSNVSVDKLVESQPIYWSRCMSMLYIVFSLVTNYTKKFGKKLNILNVCIRYHMISKDICNK